MKRDFLVSYTYYENDDDTVRFGDLITSIEGNVSMKKIPMLKEVIKRYMVQTTNIEPRVIILLNVMELETEIETAPTIDAATQRVIKKS